MKKALKIGGIILASLLAIVMVILLFLGPIARGVVQKYDEKIIGRQVEIGKMKVKLLTGNACICGLHLKEVDGKTDFVAFDTLDVSIRLRKLLKSEVEIPHITLTGPAIHVVQYDSTFNFTDILEHFSSDTTDTSSSDWKIGLYDIRISGGSIRYKDEVRDKDWVLNNLRLKVPGIYLDGENSTDAGLSLTFADHGSLTTKVQYNMGSNDFEVRLDLREFALSNLLPYLTDKLAINELKGDFSGDIHVKGNLDDILNLDIDGSLSLDELNVNDAKKQEIASLHRMDIGIDRINPQQNVYEIRQVHIDGLSSHLDIYKDGSTNFSKLLIESAPEETEGGTEAGKPADTVASAPMQLLLKELKIENTRFTYNDYSMEDAFSFPVDKIRVKAENLQLSGRNHLTVLAGLPGGGMADIQWTGTLDNLKTYQDLVVNIKNLNMKQLSPYVVHYLAYPFTDGVFSFTSENTIKNAQLQGANKVDIYRLTVGEKRKDVKPEVNIPLKAAVYVLNDKDDKIQLDIPIAGNLDNPEFSYMKLVWKTLSNLLVKVSVSPLRYMADAVGMGNTDVDKMKINPLQFDFTSEQYDFLSKLVQLARMDTNIVIEMEQQLDWDKAAHQLSVYNVKRDYYLVQNPEKQGYRLQLIDFNNINAINVKDLDFITYLNDRVGSGLEKKSVTEKSERLYPFSSMQKEVKTIAERRNQYIRYYMVKQSGLNQSQLILKNKDENADMDAYAIQSRLKEEGTEEAPENPEEETTETAATEK